MNELIKNKSNFIISIICVLSASIMVGVTTMQFIFIGLIFCATELAWYLS